MTGRLDIPGLDVSRETEDKLHAFVSLVQKWTVKINLIAPASDADIWHRHIRDSAQLATLVDVPPQHWADFGSGGGFPGIVIAVIAQDLWPMMRMTLVESDQRKAAFLRTANRELGLTVEVLSARIEAVPPLAADVISARALAPLDGLLGYIAPHLAANGCAILPKGRNAAAEIARAQATARFELAIRPSVTDHGASILVIKGIAHG